ncbi:MAG: divergent PAP2 family protein [Chloroflexi bacterium]|nr:divergent PAP2 family protein [Chloroflexota bacterium]
MPQLAALFQNDPLLAAVAAWSLAQIIKVPLDYLFTREFNWHLLLSAGGMPSSHAALVAGLAWTMGLEYGFDSAVFAIAAVFSMIVIYDATGVRRAAGEHARVINRMIEDLATGHPLKEEELKELLGHTPRQVLAGTIFGIVVGSAAWWWLKNYTA